MQIIVVETVGGTLRSEAIGWTAEDTELYVNTHNIGDTPSLSVAPYNTVLSALARGWKLLGPPTPLGNNHWDWWLTRPS